MATEQKIKEAYLQWLSTAPDAAFVTLEDAWKSGYLTLLNSLEETQRMQGTNVTDFPKE